MDIEWHPYKRSGVPVIPGTRFTVAQLLAELADGRNVEDVSAAFGVELKLLRKCLLELAASYDNPGPQKE